MPLQKFQLGSLANMDQGRLAVAFDMLLQRLIEDCKDRPELKTPRKLTLQVTVEPCTEQGGLDSVNVAFQFKDTIPTRESRTYNMAVVRGGVAFNEASPDVVRQMDLGFDPKPESTTPRPVNEGKVSDVS
jgi:hypothetical protein